MKKVLVLYAHPSQHWSEVNTPLFAAAQKIDGVTAIDLYADYPSFDIDVEREQRRLLEHDVVIFQFPLYWYSTPSILKEWQDLVLEYGFAYGEQANALQGKPFLCVLTAGGKEEAYQTDGYNRLTIREFLRPIERMAEVTGMQYLPPFAMFGARTAKEEKRVELYVRQYRQLLNALVEETLDLEQAATLPLLTHALDDLTVGESA